MAESNGILDDNKYCLQESEGDEGDFQGTIVYGEHGMLDGIDEPPTSVPMPEALETSLKLTMNDPEFWDNQ